MSKTNKMAYYLLGMLAGMGCGHVFLKHICIENPYLYTKLDAETNKVLMFLFIFCGLCISIFLVNFSKLAETKFQKFCFWLCFLLYLSFAFLKPHNSGILNDQISIVPYFIVGCFMSTFAAFSIYTISLIIFKLMSFIFNFLLCSIKKCTALCKQLITRIFSINIG